MFGPRSIFHPILLEFPFTGQATVHAHLMQFGLQ